MNYLTALIAAALCIAAVTVRADDHEKLIVPLSGPAVPEIAVRHSVELELVKAGPRSGLKVRYEVTDWPNVFFQPASGAWDWSDYTGIAVDIYNPEAEAQTVTMRVDNSGADGIKNCNTRGVSARAGAWTTLRLRFNRGGDPALWGMRGLPITGPTGGGAVLDTKRIVGFQVFLTKPAREHTLILNNFRLYGAAAEAHVSYPFVDRFGQYRNGDWPGKLKDEADLEKRANVEAAALKAEPTMPGRDRFGGWTDGPKRKATGWFRAEKVDGRWWLVTPDGDLFFSTGIDCMQP
ncbi:MAG TPA: hypothetical protein VKT77_08305, partial [Chthonomonadaceae bacterium]|nr:hypothetical protein [Chthonomonadaceae bacterium]